MAGTSWIVVTTTCDRRDVLETLALMLVEHGLCGCAQIAGPIESHYRWQGVLEVSQEYTLSIKTSSDRFDGVAAMIAQQHPYAVPQIVAVPLQHVSASYEAWLAESLAKRP